MKYMKIHENTWNINKNWNNNIKLLNIKQNQYIIL